MKKEAVFSKKIFFPIIIIIFAAIAVIFAIRNNQKNMKTINIADHKLNVWVAHDLAEQTKGLSGKPSMGESQGMLFIMSEKKIQHFWMKDMNFPLDFIWLADNKIAGVTPNIQPCPETGDCPSILSPASANYVLEVSAGWVEKNNIKVGQEVKGL